MINYINNIENDLKNKLSDEKTRHKGEIYHYTSADGLKGIIESKKLWFTNAKFLNDYSENNYIFTLLPKFPDTYKETLIEQKFFEDIRKVAENYNTGIFYKQDDNVLFADHVYVASFSKSKDNLELWNYYTKSKNSVGYNIGYISYPFKIDSAVLKFIHGEVIYKKDKQLEFVKNIVLAYNSIYRQFKEDIDKDGNSKEVFFNSFVRMLELHNIFFKHEAYKNEQEYRCAIYDVTNYSGLLPKSRNINGLLVPYLEIPYEPEMINSIGISPSSENELLKEGVEFMLFAATKGNQDIIQIWNSRIPRRY